MPRLAPSGGGGSSSSAAAPAKAAPAPAEAPASSSSSSSPAAAPVVGRLLAVDSSCAAFELRDGQNSLGKGSSSCVRIDNSALLDEHLVIACNAAEQTFVLWSLSQGQANKVGGREIALPLLPYKLAFGDTIELGGSVQLRFTSACSGYESGGSTTSNESINYGARPRAQPHSPIHSDRPRVQPEANAQPSEAQPGDGADSDATEGEEVEEEGAPDVEEDEDETQLEETQMLDEVLVVEEPVSSEAKSSSGGGSGGGSCSSGEAIGSTGDKEDATHEEDQVQAQREEATTLPTVLRPC